MNKRNKENNAFEEINKVENVHELSEMNLNSLFHVYRHTRSKYHSNRFASQRPIQKKVNIKYIQVVYSLNKKEREEVIEKLIKLHDELDKINSLKRKSLAHKARHKDIVEEIIYGKRLLSKTKRINHQKS